MCRYLILIIFLPLISSESTSIYDEECVISHQKEIKRLIESLKILKYDLNVILTNIEDLLNIEPPVYLEKQYPPILKCSNSLNELVSYEYQNANNLKINIMKNRDIFRLLLIKQKISSLKSKLTMYRQINTTNI